MKSLFLCFCIITNCFCFHNTLNAQQIPNAEKTFSKIQVWEKDGERILGNLIKEDLTNNTVKVYRKYYSGIYRTFVEISGEFVNGKSTLMIRSFNVVDLEDGGVIYRLNCTDLYDTVADCILYYENSILDSFTIVYTGRCAKFTN